jgi:hypothetical protein
MTLIMAVQAVLRDQQKTLALFETMPGHDKDFAVYLMGRNGVLEGEVDGKEKMADEVGKVMSRGTM